MKNSKKSILKNTFCWAFALIFLAPPIMWLQLLGFEVIERRHLR